MLRSRLHPPRHIHVFGSETDCECGFTFDEAVTGTAPFVLEVTAESGREPVPEPPGTASTPVARRSDPLGLLGCERFQTGA